MTAHDAHPGDPGAVGAAGEGGEPIKPAFGRIGGSECPVCLGMGERCHPDSGLIDCVEGCDRCDAAVERRAVRVAETLDPETRRVLGMTTDHGAAGEGELAEVVCAAMHPSLQRDLTRMSDHPNPRCRIAACFRCQDAAAVIAREWLPKVERRASERAWDEGWNRCSDYRDRLHQNLENPYREGGRDE